MKIARILPLFALATAAALCGTACSSETATPGTSSGTTPDRGIDGTGETDPTTAPDKNPDGAEYPTTNLGTSVGTVIRNYKVVGYPDGNPAGGLKPMSLAQFYDPTGAKTKLIHIQVVGTWCIYCRQEMKDISTKGAELAQRKVVWIVSVAEGPSAGSPSEKGDLDQWIAQYKGPFPHFFDSGSKALGVFYTSGALPFNVDIDARTMQIVTLGAGAPQNPLGEIDRVLKTLP